MRVLISNDDGVDSPGIWALYQEISKIADAIVVAPATERSAVGHAISVYNEVTLRRHIREEKEWGYGLDGTPADCVKMALTMLMKDNPPDLVISGINRGQNTGTSILYSGTVAAALEATMSGLPAVAVSLAVMAPFKGEKLGSFQPGSTEFTNDAHQLGRTVSEYIPAARFTARLALSVLKRGLPRGILLNVNVPMLPEDQLRGVAISKMGHSLFVDEFRAVSECDGAVCYRNVGDRLIQSPAGEDWDDLVLHENKISVTPLHYDLTHHEFAEQLKRWALEEEREAREAGSLVARELSGDLDAEIIG
ncbi:MAG: 5'/3'-nucleotidase SurE [Candidatus Sumerlaeaceae bacterium]